MLLPGMRGLHPYYTDLTLAFAMAGIDTVALDPCGRTAGLTARDDAFEFMPHAGAAQEVVDQMTAAVLILAAGADQATSPEDNAAFDRALTKAGNERGYVIYERRAALLLRPELRQLGVSL